LKIKLKKRLAKYGGSRVGKSTIFLVGNGFNFLIADILKYQRENNKECDFFADNIEQLEKDIREITTLWRKFDDLFASLEKEYPKLNKEQLLKMIHSVVEFFRNFEGLEFFFSNKEMETINHLDTLKKLMDKTLLKKIVTISEEFKRHEEAKGYSNLKQIFPKFGVRLKELLKKHEYNRVSIFSTNYDGVLDTLLTDNGFLFVDGFKRIEGDLVFCEEQLESSDFKMLHLHGSYKFEERYYATVKLLKGRSNENPVMIFNNPNLKEKLIKENDVLREYYYFFEKELESCNKLVIIGNSLLNEPHILRLLNKRVKSDENKPEFKLYIIDKTPKSVEENIKMEVKNIQIEQYGTIDIKSTKNLYELIETILTQ